MKTIQQISEDGEWEIPKDELVILERIGRGSFGVVKKGTWRGTDVAVKILMDGTVDHDEFVMEMDILSRLHHPNVLQLLGSSTASTPFVIVMEYMANNSLEKQNKHISYEQKIHILRDISRGMAYLHNRKPHCIIHRDMKPSNILLSKSFKAKIGDFGISSLQQSSTENYRMTGETGTYIYMAPEVFKHQAYSCKVDIWSFGMILYYMFVDKPYAGYPLETVLRELATSNSVRLNLEKLNPQLKTIFTHCVNYEPSSRWDSLILVNYCNNELRADKPKPTSFFNSLKTWYNK